MKFKHFQQNEKFVGMKKQTTKIHLAKGAPICFQSMFYKLFSASLEMILIKKDYTWSNMIKYSDIIFQNHVKITETRISCV